MFTGIISHTVKLSYLKQNVFVVRINSKFVSKTKIGDSVAVNGICLTVEKKTKDSLFFSVVPETVQRTNLVSLKLNSILNLERSVTIQTFLSGHLVQGHVDGCGKVIKIQKQGSGHEVEVEVEKKIINFLVEKGSITLNGVSLTIAKLKKKSFVIVVIPHTWQETNLREIEIGEKINVEIDIVAKYIKKFLK